MRKPVIVSDIPAHRSVIGGKKNGIFVSHVNPAELAEAIEYAYNHRANLEEWGEIGQRIVMREYTWKKVNESLIGYLLKIQRGENRD